MIIESSNNSHVKEWLKLKDKKYRDKTNSFLIEGDHLVQGALAKNIIKEIIGLNINQKISGIPFYLVSPEIMKKLSNQVSGTNIIAICNKLEEKPIKGNVCLLDCLQDPGNLGTIIRSAVAFNIKNIVLSEDTVDLYNEKVIRSSEGMLFEVNIIRKNIELVLKELKKQKYIIYGTNVKEGIELKKVDFSSKSAIIIGNEGKGMNNNLKPYCDEQIHININCESLNAGVAASIIFYEVKNGERKTR